MGIIKTSKLVHEFIRRDEEGNVESITTALDNVNLDIKEGQFIAILGHNGSGKSTLAKHINALLLPTEGTIWIDGIDTSKESELWKVRQKAGMVFQNPDNQIIGTVVEEDVGFGPENMGVPTDDIWKRVNDSLEKVGMTAYRYQSPNKLSGGQKQRVASARAMITNPSLILADEPTGALDSKAARMLLDSMETMNVELNATILMVTHDAFTASYCKRILFIKDGKIFNELVRGSDSRKQFFDRIIEVVTLLGGDSTNVF